MLTLMLSIDDFDLDKEQLWLFKDVDQKKRNCEELRNIGLKWYRKK